MQDCSAAAPSVTDAVRALTGASTRIVWSRQQSGCEDFVGITPDFTLMAFDCDDGGERAVFDTLAAYCCPIITPTGDRIVYTDAVAWEAHVVNWDGTGDQVLAPGFALTVWKDPATGTEWTYVRPERTGVWNCKSRPVTRHPIDDPSSSELVWDRSSVTRNWFRLSPDGTCAAACAPWPMTGLVTLPNGEFVEFDRGCWGDIAPDDSHRVWVFDGDHRHVKVYDKTGALLHRLHLNGGPGINGWEVYHPRWSNNPRFVTVTGPFSNNSDKVFTEKDRNNWIKNGGYNVELYIGRLSPQLTEAEEWVKLTSNKKADFFGDAWIGPRE
jgi:hypothetical protein